MIVTIDEKGFLIIEGQSDLERWALRQWINQNPNILGNGYIKIHLQPEYLRLRGHK